jgi:formate dehydrogenase subunit delta
MTRQQQEHLAKMANQIALNFGEKRDLKLAAQRTSEHLEKFWTHAMREQLAEYAKSEAETLSPAVRLLLSTEHTL